MKLLLFVVLIFFISQGDLLSLIPDTCYDGLGCFDNGYPWTTPLRPVPPPASPESVNTTFFLFFDRESGPIVLQTWPNISFEGAPFDSSLNTIFLVHGFTREVLKSWVERMARNIAIQGRANVIAVDWSQGAQGPNYLAAVSNTRTVGAEMSRVITYIVDNLGVSKANIHLVGHSLGAHVCAYASNGVGGIFHITGLDSAQPLFEGNDDKVYLDKSDACIVDAIHTDARPFIPFLGVGFMEPYGDIDFYPNGGAHQPGCTFPEVLPNDTNILDYLNLPGIFIEMTSCRHHQAVEYYSEAIRNASCIMWGHRENHLAKFITYILGGNIITPPGVSTHCHLKTCVPIGLNTAKYPARGTFLVKVEDEAPYCVLEPKNNKVMARDVRHHRSTYDKRKLCEAKNIQVD